MVDDELAWKSMVAARDGTAGEGSATTTPVGAAYTIQTTPGVMVTRRRRQTVGARFTFPVDVRRTRVGTGKFPIENGRTQCAMCLARGDARTTNSATTRYRPPGASERARSKNIVVETRRKRRTRARHVNRSVRAAFHTAGRGVRPERSATDKPLRVADHPVDPHPRARACSLGNRSGPGPPHWSPVRRVPPSASALPSRVLAAA